LRPFGSSQPLLAFKQHKPYSQQIRISALQARFNRVSHASASANEAVLQRVRQRITKTWQLATHDQAAANQPKIDAMLVVLESAVDELEHNATLAKVQSFLAPIDD
jgi:hypothetical protein